jgi:beta-N-acetylhexosaminidase
VGHLRKPIIFGCSGPALTSNERAFFEAEQPAGFILFSRNIETPVQLASLIAELKATSTGGRPAVLIDQEGGRVQRLGPPHWPAYPAMATFGRLYRNSPAKALAALRLNLARIVLELRLLGINVDCLPVLDLPADGADNIIGDRAFSDSPAVTADLGMATVEAMLEFGCLPVIKHVPGHGRARIDSHKALPVVEASLEELKASDFLPFAACAKAPLAMTAHVAFRAIDGERAASISKRIGQEIIRGHIGFEGLLISDDIGMGGLDGDFAERAAAVLEAGTDLVLHCSGDLSEMQAVAEVADDLRPQAAARLDAWLEEADNQALPNLEELAETLANLEE